MPSFSSSDLVAALNDMTDVIRQILDKVDTQQKTIEELEHILDALLAQKIHNPEERDKLLKKYCAKHEKKPDAALRPEIWRLLKQIEQLRNPPMFL